MPIVLKDMSLPDIQVLISVVESMMRVAGASQAVRTFDSVVDRINDVARVTWTHGEATLSAFHDVRCFTGKDDTDALHLMLITPDRNAMIVEPRRIDRSNLVGRSSDPTGALLSTLTALHSSLSACPLEAGAWSSPKTQNDHLHEKAFAAEMARSIPDHVDATASLSGHEEPILAYVMMPSPYWRAAYHNISDHITDAGAIRKASSKASALLPSCVMVARITRNASVPFEWELSGYRTGIEILEARDCPMERLRVLARITDGNGKKR